MINLVTRENKKIKRGSEVWVAHSAALLDAKYVKEKLAKNLKMDEKKIPVIEIGPTMTAHTGPGVVSVSILPK